MGPSDLQDHYYLVQICKLVHNSMWKNRIVGQSAYYVGLLESDPNLVPTNGVQYLQIVLGIKHPHA